MRNRSGLFLLILASLPSLTCCVKEGLIAGDDPASLIKHLPVIKDTYVSVLTPISAIAGFQMIDDGGERIHTRGVCWSTSRHPTIDDYLVERWQNVDIFNVEGLRNGTTYYLRAFAKSNLGLAYGEQVSFTTPDYIYGSVTDIDGNIYNTVQIGTQEWITENLKTTRFNDGNPVHFERGDPGWSSLAVAAYCWYDNNTVNKDNFGALYNWYAVRTEMLCPVGWHVPTDEEWTILIDFLGGVLYNLPGEEIVLNNFTDPNGFAAVLAGSLSLDLWLWSGNEGIFSPLCIFWTANPVNCVLLDFEAKKVWRYEESLTSGCSVRCLKNNQP